MATTPKKGQIPTQIDPIPARLAGWMRDARYLGIMVMQAPRAWTRMGATWVLEGGVWMCSGPGVSQWKTTQGIAELTTSTTIQPVWHALGHVLSPAPNIVLAVVPAAVTHYGMDWLEAWGTAVTEEVGAQDLRTGVMS